MKKIDLFADIFEAITEISNELSKQLAIHVKEDRKYEAYMAYGGLIALHDLMEVIHQSLIESESKPKLHDTILDPDPDWPGEHATVKKTGGIK